MSKVLCFHHSDLDGMGVKLVSMLDAMEAGEDIETFKCDYGDIDKKVSDRLDQLTTDEIIKHEVTILIGDISVQSKELAKRLDDLNKYITVILRDHHATAKWLNQYSWAKVEEKDEYGEFRCGTYWIAEYLYQEVFGKKAVYADIQEHRTLVDFVRLVDLYDTWKWMDDKEHPIVDAENLNSIFKMMKEDKFTEYILPKLKYNDSLFDSSSQILIDVRNSGLESRAKSLEKDMRQFQFRYELKSRHEMEALHKFYEEERPEKLDWAKKHLKLGYTENFRVGVVFESQDISDIGNRILKNHPELDFLIFISLPRFMSYRSSKDLTIPLGIMAKHITGYGGGHPQSAGGSLKPNTDLELMFKVIPQLVTEILTTPPWRTK